MTVDASKSQIVLPNLTPGVTYDVSVIAVKGQRESEAASESVTTGKLQVYVRVTQHSHQV